MTPRRVERPGVSRLERQPTGSTDSHLDWRRRQRRIKLAFRPERRLRHEARLPPTVRLCGMDEEWMTQIDRACCAGCQLDLAICCRRYPSAESCLRVAPASPWASSSLAMTMCESFRILVGASSALTSENRNSINRARALLFTLTRHSMKSGWSVPKLTSTCQPSSPGRSDEGERMGKVPRPSGASQLCAGAACLPLRRSEAKS